jgi:DNA-binding CsgD family transcriptional regulator
MGKTKPSNGAGPSHSPKRRMLKQPLTARETQVARLLSLGCSMRDAGAILGITVSTVDNTKSSAMAKLGVSKAATLTRVAILTGISGLRDQLTPAEKRRLRKRTVQSKQ